jgi:hypothetical protein
MKAPFALIFLAGSVCLNMVLIGRLQTLNQRPVGPVAAPEPAPAPVAAAPFHWSQLESSDYATYIANLRAIGCPEQTVREIISADVDDSYASRREPLLKIIAAGGPAGDVDQTQAALTQLRSEEAAVIRNLFGIPNSTNAPAVAAYVPAPGKRVRSAAPVVEETNAVMPLVFQAVDTNLVKLTPAQLQSIGEVRQTFMTDLGTNLDVNSPEYFKRWQAAQKQSDSLLGGMIGRQAQLNYKAAAQSPSSTGN